jgi:Uma2 family endonuclease
MSATLESIEFETFADLLHRLGDISAARVWLRPAPGTATQKDVLAIHAKTGRLCELVDGTLVEKAMGMRESLLAVYIGALLHGFVRPRKLGLVAGEAGMMKIAAGLVRIPDVSFIAWDRIPGRKVPKEPIPKLVPNLAVEVLSKTNTPAEMKRKRREYFKAGVELMWIVDPEARTVTVYTSPRNPKTLTEAQTLDGGTVLPGFKLPLRDLFAELDVQGDEQHAGNARKRVQDPH